VEVVPFDSERWTWPVAHTVTHHLGRECVAAAEPTERFLLTLDDVELTDGVIELELAVSAARAFHGVVWRVQDEENYESFFVRPHQVGNPDSIQYTPVCNGISSWQLYHGPGFWAATSFPIDGWFRIRVAFAGERGEVDVGETTEPTLAIAELKRAVAPGRVGVLIGGPGLHLARFAYDDAAPVAFRGASAASPAPRSPGVVPEWSISLPFAEDTLDRQSLAAQAWTVLASEPSGLTDLSRANGIRGGRNTVLARAIVRSERDRTTPLELGFSDRAALFLNGTPLYRGDDSYRSRDYRFLGSIGWYDTVYLPLRAGDNDLVVAVSEDIGGWGVQARFPDASGITFG
jgi:hypothetical protein